MEGKPDWQLAWEAEQRDVLSRVNFPVFAPEGLAVELGGWGGGEGEPVDSLSLRHGIDSSRRIEVDSEFEPDEVDFEEAVAERIEDQTGAKVEGVATKLIRVDGVERPFAFASGEGRWVAVGRLGDVTVTVDAVSFDPNEVHLRALADPTQVIGGRPGDRPQRAPLEGLGHPRGSPPAPAAPARAVGRQLAAAAKPAIALIATESPSPSWLGGEPKLPADARWPMGSHGPMLFVAQLSLADLDATIWTGPRNGHLHVFCDVDAEDGSLE